MSGMQNVYWKDRAILVPMENVTAVVSVSVTIDSFEQLRDAVKLLKVAGLTSAVEKLSDGISLDLRVGSSLLEER